MPGAKPGKSTQTKPAPHRSFTVLSSDYNASELSDADKLQAIEIAKTLLTASDDA